MTNERKAAIEQATGQRIASAYEPSGLYAWLKLSDGRDATYYHEQGRVVCNTPTPYAIDARVSS